ncbi:MAG: hypothetical protein ACRDHN_03805, partial [Thermomicrobiales bacterium]
SAERLSTASFLSMLLDISTFYNNPMTLQVDNGDRDKFAAKLFSFPLNRFRESSQKLIPAHSHRE